MKAKVFILTINPSSRKSAFTFDRDSESCFDFMVTQILYMLYSPVMTGNKGGKWVGGRKVKNSP